MSSESSRKTPYCAHHEASLKSAILKEVKRQFSDDITSFLVFTKPNIFEALSQSPFPNFRSLGGQINYTISSHVRPPPSEYLFIERRV